MMNKLFIYACIAFYPAVFIGGTSPSQCVLRTNREEKTWTPDEKRLMHRLDTLKGKVFTIDVLSKEDKTTYTYKVGICATVSDEYPMCGAMQTTDGKSENKSFCLGMTNSTEILGGDVWISLQYYNGHNYTKLCSQQSRVINIMFICDEKATHEQLRFMEEKRAEEREFCYYLFEISSVSICPEKKKELSVGSVICIIFFASSGVYFLLGFLYRRVVVGAKGLEQIPNYSFWQDFGNLQADGCDFLCRCGLRQQSQAYRGIDDCLDREEEERDDQLLTM